MDDMERLLCVLEEAQRIASDSNWCSPHGLVPLLSSPKTPLNAAQLDDGETVTNKPRSWKKPKDMPRRPLSAYNLFFKSERQRIVASISERPNPRLGQSGKAVGLGFAGLARDIASKWKVLDSAEKAVFEGAGEGREAALPPRDFWYGEALRLPSKNQRNKSHMSHRRL